MSAHVCYQQAKWTQAIELLQPAADPHSQILLADIFQHQAKFEPAHVLLKSAQANTNDPQVLGAALYVLGEIYYIERFMKLSGTHEPALETHESALQLRESAGDEQGMTYSLSRIGVIYERLGEQDKANNYYEHSIALGEAIDYPLGTWRPLTHLAIQLQNRGDLAAATAIFQKVVEIIQAADNRESLVYPLVNLAQAEFAAHKDLAAILPPCHEALQIAADMDFKMGYIRTLFMLGQLHREAGDTTTAHSYYQQVVDNAHPLGFTYFEQHATKALGA